MYIGFLNLEESAEGSLFLRGARQIGKSTLLKFMTNANKKWF